MPAPAKLSQIFGWGTASATDKGAREKRAER